MDIICFHNPDEENGWLSNWHLSDFIHNEITYTSMEQYMMFRKALLFNDMEMQKQIMSTTDTALIKELGRRVSGFDNIVWNGMRQVIVYEGLYAKYSQNRELRTKLLSTGNATLAECAVNDRIWATGISMTDGRRFDMSCWTGQNLLGFATMLVRDKLRREGENGNR